jgi:hypothetical protein
MFFLNALLATAVIILPALAGWTTCQVVSAVVRIADTQEAWVPWVFWTATVFCHAMAWQVVSTHRGSLLPAALGFIELCAVGLTILGCAFVDAEVRAEMRHLEQLDNKGKDAGK